jgi:hypothetical protein
MSAKDKDPSGQQQLKKTRQASSRLAGDSTHYTIGLLDPKGKPTQYTWAFPSVSTILDHVLAKPALMHWYFTNTVGAFSILLQRYGSNLPSDIPTLMSLLKQHGLGPYETRDARAKQGSSDHNDLSRLVSGEIDITSNWGLNEWWQGNKKVLRVRANEVPVVSFKHKYAGTVDLVYTYGKNGLLTLGDLKTGATVSVSAYLQLCAYQLAWNELNPSDQIQVTEIIHCPQGKQAFTVLENPFRPEQFLPIVDLYYMLESMKLPSVRKLSRKEG